MPDRTSRRSNSATRYNFGEAGGANAGGGNATGNAGGATATAQINVDELVSKVASAVMAQLGEGRANAGGGPPAAAYRAGDDVDRHEAQVTAGEEDEEGKLKSDAEEGAGMNPPKPDKNADGTPRQRHATAAGKKAMWSQVDDAGPGKKKKDGEYDDMDGEWHTRQAADLKEAKKYIAAQNKTIEDLTASVDELKRHRADEQTATKKSLLKQKFQTLVASGHAIGSAEALDRHVGRCMKFSIDEIEAYIGDLKETSPKIKVRERHATDEGVVRDPSSAKRFSDEDQAELDRYSIDEDVMKLADLLPGM